MSRAILSVAISVPLLRASIIAALCTLLMLLGGCSLLRLAYGQADAWAFRWLDGYFEFDDAQSLRTREALGSWFAWNRRTQVVGYADFLGQIDVAVQVDTSADKVCALWDEVRHRIEVGAEQALPALADVAVTLKPAQIQNVERRYARSNREFRDEFLQDDPAKRAREAVRRVVNRAESFYGDLDAGQKDAIARWVAESPYDANLALEERQRRQQDALQLMRRLGSGSVGTDRAQAEIRTFLHQFERSPRAAYRRYADGLVRYNCRMAAAIHNSTTPAQRLAASRKLRGWAADLRGLGGDGA